MILIDTLPSCENFYGSQEEGDQKGENPMEGYEMNVSD